MCSQNDLVVIRLSVGRPPAPEHDVGNWSDFNQSVVNEARAVSRSLGDPPRRWTRQPCDDRARAASRGFPDDPVRVVHAEGGAKFRLRPRRRRGTTSPRDRKPAPQGAGPGHQLTSPSIPGRHVRAQPCRSGEQRLAVGAEEHPQLLAVGQRQPGAVVEVAAKGEHGWPTTDLDSFQ